MLNKLKCLIFGHQYYIHQKLTDNCCRVKCHRCPGDWGMNRDVRAFIKWDAELEALYSDVFKIRIIK